MLDNVHFMVFVIHVISSSKVLLFNVFISKVIQSFTSKRLNLRLHIHTIYLLLFVCCFAGCRVR